MSAPGDDSVVVQKWVCAVIKKVATKDGPESPTRVHYEVTTSKHAPKPQADKSVNVLVRNPNGTYTQFSWAAYSLFAWQAPPTVACPVGPPTIWRLADELVGLIDPLKPGEHEESLKKAEVLLWRLSKLDATECRKKIRDAWDKRVRDAIFPEKAG